MATRRLIFYAFDLLHLNGKDLRNEPLDSRRTKLKELVRANPESRLQFSEEFTEGGDALFRACVEHGLEGIVSKLASSKYRSGRSKTWLKTKCFTESAFVIIGTARDRKTRALLALLARADRHGLSYAGTAFITLSGQDRDELRTHLEVNKVERCPLPRFRFPDAQWVKPHLVARVRHSPGQNTSDMERSGGSPNIKAFQKEESPAASAGLSHRSVPSQRAMSLRIRGLPKQGASGATTNRNAKKPRALLQKINIGA